MREVSLPQLQAMMAQATSEIDLAFVKIEHDDLPDAIRLVMNTEPITRADGVYVPWYFDAPFPDEAENEIPRTTITVDNTDLEVNDAIRSLAGTPKVTLFSALASSPDTIEAGPWVFDLKNVVANEQQIQGELGMEDDAFGAQFPAQTYNPSNSAGLFV